MAQRLMRQAQDPRSLQRFFTGEVPLMVESALNGCMGKLWICSNDPQAVLCETGDFLFLAGDDKSSECQRLLAPFVQEEKYRILIGMTPQLHACAGRIVQGKAALAQRFSFRTPQAFDKRHLQQMAQNVPLEIRLQPMDEACCMQAMAQEWSRDFCSQFDSFAHYLSHGLGVAALKGDELIGGASSYVYAPDGIEIEIDVRNDQRGRGIASACAAKLVLECLQRGLRPGWDAANPTSAHLAQKLGFVPSGAYPAWLLHENDAQGSC